MITKEEERKYLGAFYARGSGSVRGQEVAKTTARWTDHNLVVEFNHSKYGTIILTLIEATVGYAYDSLEYDYEEDRLAALPESAARVVEYGTWNINLESKTLDAHHENWIGHKSTRIDFEDITLVYPSVVSDDGTCKVCGSDEFFLRSFGTQALKSVGPYNFVSLRPAYLKIHNASPTISCTQCQTPHSSSGTFNGGFVVDGVSNRREDLVTT